MVDVHTPEQRRFNMSRIRNRNTKPEMIVRSMAHKLGYRYRLHNKKLPGKPDLTFAKRKKVIFVHGCFFHMHACKYGSVTPRTNPDFWRDKRMGNVERDKKNINELQADGWSVLIIWECETRASESLSQTIKEFLGE